MRRLFFIFSRLFLPVFLALVIFPGESFALVTFRRPLDIILSRPVSSYYDNNSSPSAVSYKCDSQTYNDHRGTDFRGARYTPIYAAASGMLNYRYDNCTSTGFFGSKCGGGFGNHVRIGHDLSEDGWSYRTTTIYAHMQQGTPALYQFIYCGWYVGQIGSSGSSTAPHLHFEVRRNGNPRDDPYAGSCNARGAWSEGYWTNQYGFDGNPTTACAWR